MSSRARALRYGSPSTDGTTRDGIATLRERLAQRVRCEIDEPQARRAAVLVPIVAAQDGLRVLCFERTHEVLEHKGEICLPGGSVEPEDEGYSGAALREAFEELGIVPSGVELLGMLDDVHTIVSGYVITPVVGFIASAPDVVCDALEVARPISVPLARLLEAGIEAYELRGPDGTLRTIYAYQIGEDRIWGATARILHGLLSLWFGSEDDTT